MRTSGHFQTIWCTLGDFSNIDLVPYKRTLLRVPDGGSMSVLLNPSSSITVD